MNNFSHTPTDLHQVRDIQDGLQIRALGFIQKHAGSHLDRKHLLKRAMAYLVDLHPMAEQTAETIAARALCEYESRGAALTLDLDNSTAYMLVVNDPSRGCKRVFSMADIRRLLSTADMAPIRTPSYSAAMAGTATPQ
ncbi:hypothetical protein [Paracandidimonas soli]|uniref:Uncharacterized protein n=1 Tax=Paracandidimonas soli TaxID=1917182 RepID=A0A4R3V9V5_9BURK|nr:hypothetical protein [Paracandidimonas soli]TCV00533.1 hypothetical protein EV686_103113 [Paracandidimonas soli]